LVLVVNRQNKFLTNQFIITKIMLRTHTTTKRPSLFWLATEPSRALTEFGMSYSYNALFKSDKKGDGHPVMILPGFMSTKASTAALRNHLTNLGYEVHDWGMGRNLGKVEYIPFILAQLDGIFKRSGQQISLIGWSLGGIFARQLAKERPNIVRQVITLGTPFADLTEPNNIEWLYSMITGGKKAKDVSKTLLENIPLPAPVPTTAIYSKEDGVVPWHACMESVEDAWHQNIQVHGSHIGLGYNQCVFAVLEDRLQFDRNNWRHFKPKGFMNNRLFFPSL
jgi:pimeloyl-ACP methyl ester carboxylesterase